MPPKTTPMLRQYLAIKEEHPDCLLLYRMGDFFELFFDDAKVAAKALEITLTARGKHQDEPIPMCGVPHHSVGNYIARLIEQGFKVAICDQVEDPRQAKGLVKREVVQIISQGTFTDPEHLNAKENNYLAAVDPLGREGRPGLAYLDLSTGQFVMADVDSQAELVAELNRLGPSEVLLPEKMRHSPRLDELAGQCAWGPGGQVHLEFLPGADFDRRRAAKRILDHFRATDLAGLGLDPFAPGLAAAGALLSYAGQTQKAGLGHITGLEVERPAAYLRLDDITVRHLELFHTLGGGRGKGTLINVLDETVTAMGGRLIRRWLAYPLAELTAIRDRQAVVAAFYEDTGLRDRVRELLSGVADLERLCGRMVMERALPREVAALKDSALRLPEMLALLSASGAEALAGLARDVDDLADLAEQIGRILIDEPPNAITEGGLIQEGFDPELDELNRLKSDGQSYIAALEETERQRTGITNLRVKYTRVFGYCLEVSKANQDKVPDHYVRKQTLVNAERYTTAELDELEQKVLSAGGRAAELEYRHYTELRHNLAEAAERIKATAARLAAVDAAAALAEVARRRDYRRPVLEEPGLLELTANRHPVVEVEFTEEPFVPNDIHMDMADHQVMILTGPNMAGKSTILRQAALTVVMAQMGGFVPSASARVGLVDQIFTRVGAGDELARGRSTFMVEMSETARILTQATPRSLVVLDEIGRGTSTFDGLAIAWSVAEFLHDLQGRGVKTMMATHYHELVALAGAKSRAVNYTVAVKKVGQRIVFLRTLAPGGVSRSYGIEVARLAGLPGPAIKRAREILAELEAGGMGRLEDELADPGQPSLFSAAAGPDVLRDRLAEVEPDSLSPLEALNILYEIKELA